MVPMIPTYWKKRRMKFSSSTESSKNSDIKKKNFITDRS